MSKIYLDAVERIKEVRQMKTSTSTASKHTFPKRFFEKLMPYLNDSFEEYTAKVSDGKVDVIIPFTIKRNSRY